MTIALAKKDQNMTIWYSTRVLKYFHPSFFHCYYAGKETYESGLTYISNTTFNDIGYNLIYKSGQIIDAGRIIYQVTQQAPNITDRDYYVIARSAGQFINIILEPDSPRTAYPPIWPRG
jgi:hypothetical protein